MDNTFTARIQQFLQLKNPTEDQIIDGARMLLQLSPARNRGLYNSAMRRPKAMLPWIRTDLKKHLAIRQRGLETSQVERYNRETIKQVEQTLSQVPSTVEQDSGDTPLVPQLGIRGQRADHDRLPEEIQAIWERNGERWKKMRSLHAQLAQMIAKPDYAPCDGNELCFMLRQVDTELRNDYEIYDSFSLTQPEKKMAAPAADSVEVFTDNVKTIQNARTAISRGLSRKTAHTQASLKKMQDAVNTLSALRQSLKAETIEKLKALGVAVPDNLAHA